MSLLPFCTFEEIPLGQANDCLVRWGHKMGKLQRGNQGAWCHALTHEGTPVAVTTASYLIAERVGGAPWLTRENTVELSRLCAARGGLCRVALRLWREFVFPGLPFEFAMSYQDAALHSGATYRFDGWKRVATSRSGPDTRSGRPGRNKVVWVWRAAGAGVGECASSGDLEAPPASGPGCADAGRSPVAALAGGSESALDRQ